MTRYLIEVEYTDDEHKGKTYRLDKTGHIVSGFTLIENTYRTEANAKRAISQYIRRDESDTANGEDVPSKEYRICRVEY